MSTSIGHRVHDARNPIPYNREIIPYSFHVMGSPPACPLKLLAVFPNCNPAALGRNDAWIYSSLARPIKIQNSTCPAFPSSYVRNGPSKKMTVCCMQFGMCGTRASTSAVSSCYGRERGFQSNEHDSRIVPETVLPLLRPRSRCCASPVTRGGSEACVMLLGSKHGQRCTLRQHHRTRIEFEFDLWLIDMLNACKSVICRCVQSGNCTIKLKMFSLQHQSKMPGSAWLLPPVCLRYLTTPLRPVPLSHTT